jgi:hypothetical protein
LGLAPILARAADAAASMHFPQAQLILRLEEPVWQWDGARRYTNSLAVEISIEDRRHSQTLRRDFFVHLTGLRCEPAVREIRLHEVAGVPDLFATTVPIRAAPTTNSLRLSARHPGIEAATLESRLPAPPRLGWHHSDEPWRWRAAHRPTANVWLTLEQTEAPPEPERGGPAYAITLAASNGILSPTEVSLALTGRSVALPIAVTNLDPSAPTLVTARAPDLGETWLLLKPPPPAARAHWTLEGLYGRLQWDQTLSADGATGAYATPLVVRVAAADSLAGEHIRSWAGSEVSLSSTNGTVIPPRVRLVLEADGSLAGWATAAVSRLVPGVDVRAAHPVLGEAHWHGFLAPSLSRIMLEPTRTNLLALGLDSVPVRLRLLAENGEDHQDGKDRLVFVHSPDRNWAAENPSMVLLSGPGSSTNTFVVRAAGLVRTVAFWASCHGLRSPDVVLHYDWRGTCRLLGVALLATFLGTLLRRGLPHTAQTTAMRYLLARARNVQAAAGERDRLWPGVVLEWLVIAILGIGAPMLGVHLLTEKLQWFGSVESAALSGLILGLLGGELLKRAGKTTAVAKQAGA